MNLAFVTTMNQAIYEAYGNRYISEFENNADDKIKLFVVFEGELPSNSMQRKSNVLFLPFASPEHNQFIEFFGKLYEAQGIKVNFFNEAGKQKINIKNDYRFNAIKFSFKPFSIHQILNFLPENLDYLIWTDADLRCSKKFNAKDLMKFLPHDNAIISYLGRKNMYSECGFMGYHLKNDHTKKFIDEMINIYCTGKIFSFREWHDSYIFDELKNIFEKELNCQFTNISGAGFETDHPFVNSGLEEFFDHLKGRSRKELGRSKEDDYLSK